MVDRRTVEHATIVIERPLRASPARVFRAWSDPAERARWESPGTDWEADAKREFRLGAREVARFGPPGGPMFTADSRYDDIVQDRRIVSSYTIDDGDGRRISASLMTVEFLADGDGTMLVLTEQAAFLDGSDNPADRKTGWGQMLDKLTELIEGAI
ncbi:MAG TPA: SRPBCC family protein [Geminicoccus sp.]|jgi:uncharacterized protein YndB with AHSA1/START domain|uniref:SRPBCC family protein n=1 Tax=Geminicoccus sp. TaxID=2024832 RepID=UPI002E30B0EE|nr:SRPBCC family protein [Geminicoccus sp.]HEX2525634.1 SRPBCC family protein [Geminicoccus sp.]